MEKIFRRVKSFGVITTAALMSFIAVVAAGCGGDPVDEEEFSPIESVLAIGTVDRDGAKVKAIAVEYEEDLTGADVSADKYEIMVYDPRIYSYKSDDGEVGDITDIYINDKAEISVDGGTDSGNYVIIEVFTDYYASTELTFTTSLKVRVTQVADITLGNGEIIPAGNVDSNNLVFTNSVSPSGKVTQIANLNPDGFVIPEIEGFKFYTDYPDVYGATDGGFVVENCFNQQDGKYYTVSLSYALYLPENYSKDGNYAMVTIDNPAANAGTHPIVSTLQTRNPAVFASEWAQNLVREQHESIDGLIVVVPVITERVNDNGGTPAEYQALVALWDYIIDEYSVDKNYVYGTGQSVGGMELLETNRNRDNFFAGIMLYEDQWSQNYFIDTIFYRDMVADSSIGDTAPMHYPRTDAGITWDYYLDSDGNAVYEDHDPYNYYYLVSDDNILIMNKAESGMSTDMWNEMKYLYYDTVGYELGHEYIDANDSLGEQNTALTEYVDREGDALNINWVSLYNSGGGNSDRMLDSSYEWLLKQSRLTEVAREKLDINKPFELAATQLKTEERTLSFTTVDKSPIYYLTAAQNSGTRFYNSAWLNLGSVADAEPGWLPEGMSWENGVGGAEIQNFTLISDSAVAIKFDKDMSNLAVSLKGDKVYNHITKTYRDDDFIVLDPFEFFDADGKLIEIDISNVYVNSTASTLVGRNRGEGSGVYVIIEFKSSFTVTPSTMLQRMTLHTDKYVVSALPWLYTVA